MKRQMRRSLRKLGRKVDDIKSYATSLVRSTSAYPSNHHLSIQTSSTISSASSDSGDDMVFEAATDDVSMDGSTTEDTSVVRIPCEFCHEMQTSGNIHRHQVRCSQNPNSSRRRAPNPNRANYGPLRRAISEITSVTPSAPPRSRSPSPRTRSPSPTEGYPIPSDLQCPITQSLFTDPVVASDGHTYERSAIVQWLQTQKISPLTREAISIDKLNPNRIVKKMVEDFRAECKRKRALYKYRLDVDLKKSEQVPYIKTNTKLVYKAEWIKKNSVSTNSNIVLTYLTSTNAEKIADVNCRLEPHPNIIRVFGRVEHNDTGILLVQECPPSQTLAQFMKNVEKERTISILDRILYQISSALQHLNKAEIVYGQLTSDNIYVYQSDDRPEDIVIKLINDEFTSEPISTKSDVQEFGIFAIGMYSSLELNIHDKHFKERRTLFERCLATDPNERPTFDELTNTFHDFMTDES